MTWHQGYALSQTLFTSLHMYSLLTPYYRPLNAIVFKPKRTSPEQPDPLISSVLRAFCLGIIKSCDAVVQEITSEHYYEEEDFVTQTFTQYMLNDVTHEDVIDELHNALDVLKTQDVSQDIKEALQQRLQLRIHLLEALEPLSLVEVVDKTEIWKAVLDSVNRVNKTAKLAKARSDFFSERVQRHLASNTPPTPMIKTSWEEAYPRFTRMAEDNIEAHRFASINNPSPLNVTVSSPLPLYCICQNQPNPNLALRMGLFQPHTTTLDLLPFHPPRPPLQRPKTALQNSSPLSFTRRHSQPGYVRGSTAQPSKLGSGVAYRCTLPLFPHN